ncbi:MAG: Gldg family protein [Clostridiaceae bacterium]
MKIKKMFKNKKCTYSGFSPMNILFILSLLVVLNLICFKVNVKIDLTKNQLFSLTEDSENIIDNLEKKISIIALYKVGNEDRGIKEILNRYDKLSDNIEIKYLDTEYHPELKTKYQGTLDSGTIILDDGENYKIIKPSELVDYDYTTNQITSYDIESSISLAILNLISEEEYKIYQLQGENEDKLSSTITSYLENSNYKVENINLSKQNINKEENSLLLILSPKEDLEKEVCRKIEEYLMEGGRMIFIMDALNEPLSNFNELFNTFGVCLNNSLIVEGNTINYVSNSLYLLPNMQNESILKSLINKDLPIIFPIAEPIEDIGEKKDTLVIHPLLTTSDKSWSKESLISQDYNRAEEDKIGPFNIAVSVENLDYNSKVVILSSSQFLSDNLITYNNIGNLDFLMNCLNWTQDKDDAVYIKSKQVSKSYLNMNDNQTNIFSFLFLIIIPLGVIIVGIIVWTRRRNL